MTKLNTGFTRELLADGKILDICDVCGASCICDDDAHCRQWEMAHVKMCKASPATMIFMAAA
jgi:hypothetical protein